MYCDASSTEASSYNLLEPSNSLRKSKDSTLDYAVLDFNTNRGIESIDIQEKPFKIAKGFEDLFTSDMIQKFNTKHDYTDILGHSNNNSNQIEKKSIDKIGKDFEID